MEDVFNDSDIMNDTFPVVPPPEPPDMILYFERSMSMSNELKSLATSVFINSPCLCLPSVLNSSSTFVKENEPLGEALQSCEPVTSSALYTMLLICIPILLGLAYCLRTAGERTTEEVSRIFLRNVRI